MILIKKYNYLKLLLKFLSFYNKYPKKLIHLLVKKSPKKNDTFFYGPVLFNEFICSLILL